MDRFSIAFHALFTPTWWRAGAALSLALATVLSAGCATRLDADGRAAVAGKTFVVTGASSGFGRGVARELGRLRANVVLAARRGEVLDDVASEVAAAGGQALVVVTDVSRADEVVRLGARAVERFGDIDVWINNAGVGAIGPFERIPAADHERVIDVNLKGVTFGSHTALQQFLRQGRGTLVNVGSVESAVPLAYHSSYAATKAGVLALGRALNEELRLAGARDIVVATVMPWAADTPFFAHAANHSGGTPRMAAMDDAAKVVDAIVWVSMNPREELPVGWKARGAVVAHAMMPDATERLAADVANHMQVVTAPAAPATHGALHQPTPDGLGVDGGVRQRMREEDSRRREQLDR